MSLSLYALSITMALLRPVVTAASPVRMRVDAGIKSSGSSRQGDSHYNSAYNMGPCLGCLLTLTVR